MSPADWAQVGTATVCRLGTPSLCIPDDRVHSRPHLSPGPARVGGTACPGADRLCSYSPGWEYTVPTSILKEPTRVPLRSRFLE